MRHDSMGFSPSPELFKMMSGGGYSGFLGNLGKVFQGQYAENQAEREKQAKLDLDKFNAETQRQNSTNIGNYYNQQVEAQKQRMAQEQMDRDTALNATRIQILDKQPNAMYPTSGELQSMPMDTQTTVRGLMANEAQKIAEAKALDQKAVDMARSLSDYEAKKRIDQKYSTSNTTDIFGAGMKDINVGGKDVKAVHIGNGNFFDGTRMYKAGEYTLGTVPKPAEDKGTTINKSDGSTIVRYNDGREVVTKEPSISDRAAMQDFDAKATEYVNDAFSSMNGTWQKAMDFLGADNSEKAQQAKLELHRMYKNGELSGLTKEEAMEKAYAKVGAPVGIFGARTTKEQQAKAFTGSVLEGSDSSKITPDVVEQYFISQGKPLNKEAISVMTTQLKNIADAKAGTKAKTDSFVDAYGLDKSLPERVIDKATDTQNSLMSWLGDKGLLSAGDKKYWDDRAGKKEYSNNWSIANEQIDVAPILVEVAKYAPTIGMSPVNLGGRFLNILGNAGKFGSADAMMAEMYGDDWKTAAAYGAIPMGTYGAFMKVKKATPKP